MTRFLSLLLIPICMAGAARAGCYPHPNLIWCAEAQEGFGSTIRDEGPFGLTGTFVGGAAWVKASRPQSFAHTAASMTPVEMGNNVLSFPGTIGVEVDTPPTSVFDFSGNKPYVIVFYFQPPGFPLTENQTLIAFTDSSSAIGWSIHMNTEGAFVVAHIGAANSAAGRQVRDTNPHTFAVARNGGTLVTFLDRKLYRIQTGFGDMTSCTNQPLGLARLSISAAGVWSGKLTRIAIYNHSTGPTPEHAAAFLQNVYDWWDDNDMGHDD
jgi:hypothetical protein